MIVSETGTGLPNAEIYASVAADARCAALGLTDWAPRLCTFIVKVRHLQEAGAVGVIIADNVAGAPPPALGGSDPAIVIPAVRITFEDGQKLKAAIARRTRIHSGLYANLGINLALRAGTDALGRMLMYAPRPIQLGSSVSHYDISAAPNPLMEAAINADLRHAVKPPHDLTYPLLKDIGW